MSGTIKHDLPEDSVDKRKKQNTGKNKTITNQTVNEYTVGTMHAVMVYEFLVILIS